MKAASGWTWPALLAGAGILMVFWEVLEQPPLLQQIAAADLSDLMAIWAARIPSQWRRSPEVYWELTRRILGHGEPLLAYDVIAEALKLFYEIREVPGLKKKPSTSELLDWLKLLMVEDIGPETLRERDPKKLIPPLHGALIKNEQDVHLFERLAFMARREGR